MGPPSAQSLGTLDSRGGTCPGPAGRQGRPPPPSTGPSGQRHVGRPTGLSFDQRSGAAPRTGHRSSGDSGPDPTPGRRRSPTHRPDSTSRCREVTGCETQAGRQGGGRSKFRSCTATWGPIRRGAATAARAPRPQCTVHERGAEQPFQPKMGPIVTEETWQDFYINVTWGNTTLRSLSQNQRQTEGMFATYNAELVSLMNKAPTI